MKTQAIILVAFFLILSINASAKIWRVNNSDAVEADFTTAQEAHDGAITGDTLYFEGSTKSYGNLIMDKRLVIIGPGYFLESNPNTQVNKSSAKITRAEINDGAEGSIIMGMDFWANGGYQHDFTISTDDITLRRCLFNQIVIQSLDDGKNVIISQCFIMYSGIKNKYTASNNSHGMLIITNCIINGHIWLKSLGHTIVNNYIEGNFNVYSSKVSNNIIKGSIEENHENTLKNNLSSIGSEIGTYFNLASESPDGKFILSDNSPAKGAGENGIDCGPFGDNYPYVLSGIPKGPHIYDATVSATVTNEEGLSISLKIKTQP